MSVNRNVTTPSGNRAAVASVNRRPRSLMRGTAEGGHGVNDERQAPSENHPGRPEVTPESRAECPDGDQESVDDGVSAGVNDERRPGNALEFVLAFDRQHDPQVTAATLLLRGR